MIEYRKLRSICHASVGCNDLDKAKQFYQPLLATLGIELVSEYQHALAFGKGYPEFWLQLPFNQQAATCGNGVHFGFVALSKAQVDEFYRVAMSLGATDNGAPGPRKDYGEPYYGCFIIAPEGNKIEASYWHLEKQNKRMEVNRA